jgi:ABC-type nitrate/sulfonate/bicarbonate transport system permease component
MRAAASDAGPLARLGPPLAVFVLILAGWQAAVLTTDLPTVVLPAPLDVLGAGLGAGGRLLGAAAVTGATAGLGLLVGTAVGLALAFSMVASPTARVVVQPYLVALRIAPLVAIAPLVFLWVGSGLGARALLVATLTVFPVALSGLDGLRSTPRPYLDLLRSVDAGAFETFVHVRLPAAAPSLFAGVKLAAALSVIGTVVAEFLTLRAGLGYEVFASANDLETALTFAALLTLVFLGLAFYLSAAALERLFVAR